MSETKHFASMAMSNKPQELSNWVYTLKNGERHISVREKNYKYGKGQDLQLNLEVSM